MVKVRPENVDKPIGKIAHSIPAASEDTNRVLTTIISRSIPLSPGFDGTFQVAVSAPHTLALEDADMFEGAFLYATFNINGFTYRSVQEVDPVDMLRLIGAAGGILGE